MNNFIEKYLQISYEQYARKQTNRLYSYSRRG